MEIRRVGVLGCGLMGSGIAQVAATAGFEVTVLEVEQRYLDKGFAGIRPLEVKGHDQDRGPGRVRHHHRGRNRKRR